MKKFLKLFLDSIKSFDGSKRPEEVEDWKELMGNLVLFLFFEVIIVLLLLTSFIAGIDYAFLVLYIFTMANFVATTGLTITEVIIILSKKRKGSMKNREKGTQCGDSSILMKAWSYEHPPWA